ncbi:MAG: site-specific DNA-methyltransferase [Verrucomicrobiota bacterium JB022]|nr:site-specific DNA-methyltransferase [Verrucomicrobiota bacterium JB022]
MPELNWIGKSAVRNHLKEVPTHLLEPAKELSCGDEDGNLIVEGDNLLALQALLPRYAGKVKCIYIDPPYNTGNESWVYNDNVNAPEIKRWLGRTVGKEAEDLSRHDKWLCMMYPRLQLLRKFLSEDGAIFISIDDNEVATLRILMDEIFGRDNFIATILWQKIFSPKNSAKYLSEDHDYIVLYSLNAEKWRPNLIQRAESAISRYKNPDNDHRGPWTSGDIQARNYYSEGTYSITCPSGRVIEGPGKGMYWRFSKQKFAQLDAEQRIWWGPTGNNMPRLKRFLSEVKQGVVPQTLWFHQDVGNTQEAKKELLQLVSFESSNDVFITPKPTRLIQRILQIASDGPSLILDSFAGSGTTAHAVLKQNAEDQGDRKFILVEMEPNIARDVTAERVRRVVEGYTDSKGNRVEGLGSGFQYCRLSNEPLFQPSGAIRDDVTFAQLAEYVWFIETGVGYTGTKATSPLLGVHDKRGIYLLFNGILKDRKPSGGNILTSAILASLPPHDGPRVIYAAGNRVPAARLQEAGIIFKQTPYDLHR